MNQNHYIGLRKKSLQIVDRSGNQIDF